MDTRKPCGKARRLIVREPVSHTKNRIPIDLIRANVPHPRAASRRLERETKTLLAFPQFCLRACALHGFPCPFRDVPNQGHFRGPPDSRRRAVHAKRSLLTLALL